MLDMQSAAALVPGAALETKTSRVRVLSAFMYAGAPAEEGTELTLPRVFAVEMASAGKAEILPEPEPEPEQGKPGKPAPAAKPKA